MAFVQKMVALSAPSGAGKTTLARKLLVQEPSLAFSISACTRQPRTGEQHGVDYYFLSPEAFVQKVEEKAFVEWEEVHQKQRYGTLNSEMNRLKDKKKHVLFDIDIRGAQNLKRIYGTRMLAVLIRPPSLQVLEQRLRGRGTEDTAGLHHRLQQAAHELRNAQDFDCVLVNNDLQHATHELITQVSAFLYKKMV